MNNRDDLALDVLAIVLEHEVSERARVLVRECKGDEQLIERVEALLAEYEQIPRMFLGGDDSPKGDERTVELPDRIGDYRIVRMLGHGGMGVVYEAVQTNPVRHVALKIIKPGFISSNQAKRFQREADLLGKLRHSGIAQIYEADVAHTPQGSRPYFVMELIDGVPLDSHAERHGLDRIQRLELLARVCEAIEYAHQCGIVHRDLKPSNVLVVDPGNADSGTGSSRDLVGQPKILDFGVSRAVDTDLHTTTHMTEAGQLIGTLAYMSPEQIEGASENVGIRSDVYSLGVIGYELVSGTKPLAIDGLMVAEAARVIRDEDPTPLRSHSKTLAGDIETIIAKAMDRSPDRRYSSAGEMAADLRRVIADEPIEARPASAVYRFRKFTRRNRGLVTGIGIAFIVLMIGVVTTSLGWAAAIRTNNRLDEALTELQTSHNQLEIVSAFQANQLTDVSPELMGVRIRGALLEQIPEQKLAAIGHELDVVNFTDVALNTLETDILEPTLRAIDVQFADHPLVRARLLQSLATTLLELGFVQLASEPQTMACQIRDGLLGGNHPDSIESHTHHARLISKQGDHEEAIRIMQRVLSWHETDRGAEAESTVESQIVKAEYHRLAREFDESERLLRSAMDTSESRFGHEHWITNRATRGLGATLMAAGLDTEAEQFVRTAYEQRVDMYGPEDPQTVDAMTDLASIANRLGHLEEAVELAQRVLDIRSSRLGGNHPLVIHASVSLGVYLDAQSRFSEAAELYRSALTKRRHSLGEAHPDTLRTSNNLAMALEMMGEYDEAEDLLRDTIRIRRGLLGDLHRDTLTTLGNLGLLLKNKGEHEQAEPYYIEMLEGMRSTLGNDSPYTLQAIQNYGVLLLEMGRPDEAIPLYEESLDGRRRVLGEDHPATLNAIYNMGNMLVSQLRLEEAEPYCEQALAKYSELGELHIGTLYSLGNLATLRAEQGRLDEAAELYRTQHERMSEAFGAEHQATITAFNDLEDILERQTQQQELAAPPR